MTKTITFTLLGALLGSTLVGCMIYLSGSLLQALGIQLYYSEADQQRNFNIAFFIWIVFTLASSWLGYRIGKKSQGS